MLDLAIIAAMFARDGFTPAIDCVIDGQNVSSILMPRMIKAEVVDATGMKNDTLDITVDASRPKIAKPKVGAKVEFSGGYKETGLVRFGSYTITELSKEGPPTQLTISAKAFDDRKAAKGRRHKAYSETTLRQVYQELAGRMGLTLAIESGLGATQLSYLAQRNESDWQLATRLAEREGAVASAKDGRLVVARPGEGKSVTGKTLPPIIVTPNDLAGAHSWRVKENEEAKHGKIRAPWNDRATGRIRSFELPGTDGSSDATFTFREPFQNEADAKRAAEGKRRELGRAGGQLWMKIYGRPTAQAEAMVTPLGVDEDADLEWSVERVRHIFMATAAYLTEIEAVSPGSGAKKK
jgi:phage protein D